MDNSLLLQTKDINKLLNEIDYSPVGLRDRAMVGIFYGIGLKPKEGLNLKISDISLKERMIFPSNNKGIELNEKVYIWIRDYINYGRPQLLKEKKNNTSDYLFITQRGNNASKLTLNRRIKFLQLKSKLNNEVTITLALLSKNGQMNTNKRKSVSIKDQIKDLIM